MGKFNISCCDKENGWTCFDRILCYVAIFLGSVVFVLFVFYMVIAYTDRDWFHIKPKVLNGRRVRSIDYPYVGSLVRKSKNVAISNPLHTFRCVLTMLTQRWLITTAECLVTNKVASDKTQFKVLTGSNTWLRGRYEFNIDRAEAHPSYSKDKTTDVGLIRVLDIINYSETTSVINIATFKYTPKLSQQPGEIASTVGWDIIDDTKGYSEDLTAYDLLVRNQRDCGINTHTSKLICTGQYLPSGKNCGTGMGSPMMYNGFLVGLATKDSEVCTGDTRLFAALADVVDWINEISVVQEPGRISGEPIINIDEDDYHGNDANFTRRMKRSGRKDVFMPC